MQSPHPVARHRTAVGLSLAILGLLGCGPDDGRLAISGNVVLNGTPLDRGSIRFTSKGAGALMVSGALIQDGAYNIPQEKGLLAGTYYVDLSSPDAKAPPILDPPTGMMMAPERIPPDFNVDSTQTIEVTPDGDNEFNFDINTKAAK